MSDQPQSPYAAEEAGMDFISAYEGPAVDEGRMNARIFAPALFGIAGLVERSSDILYPGRRGVTVEVNGNFRRGSFEFDLHAAAATVTTMAGAVPTLLTALTVSDIDTILKWVGLKGGDGESLLGILPLLRGRKIEAREPLQGGGVQITINGDNNHVVLSPEVLRLAQDSTVRECLEAVGKPTKLPGITGFRSGGRKGAIHLVPEDFDAPLDDIVPDEELADSTYESAVEVVNPAFRDGNSWRVSRGGETFFVRILDEAFLRRVDAGEPFAKGDYLIATMRMRATSSSSGLKAEHEIVQVHEHRRRSQQASLAL